MVLHFSQVYMTYTMRNPMDLASGLDNGRATGTYRPSSQLTATEIDLQAGKGIYQHFHAPFNDHSRFLTCASPADRAAYRDLPRMAPPPWDGTTLAGEGKCHRLPKCCERTGASATLS